jgi:hypothetical protein
VTTIKASSHSVNFADQTLPNVVSGTFDEMQFELYGVEMFELGLAALNIGNTVSGLYFEITGGFFPGARDFAIPVTSVSGGATFSSPNVSLATPNNTTGSGLVYVANPPPFINVQPYAAAWPASANGSFLRAAACWR